MKVVLLTTDTTHHTYFAWKLNEQFPLRAILLEAESLVAPFDTHHPFESARDNFEHETLLRGFSGSIDSITDTHRCTSINDGESVERLRNFGADIALVFGTRKLQPEVITATGRTCLNLHGGNPEEYRGLDSYLWTIYHADFENLVCTLHHLDSGLDTGDIAFQTRLPLVPRTPIHELRAINTRECLNMTLEALRSFQSSGRIPARKQSKRGRYYSFMPTVLKEECVRTFNRYVAQL